MRIIAIAVLILVMLELNRVNQKSATTITSCAVRRPG
jgi:hypothetical protein